MNELTSYMTVLQKLEDKSEIVVQIDLFDVDFIETKNRKLVYHIGDNTYYQISNKSELDHYLIQYGFDPLDRPNLVNLKKIRKFDKNMGKVYFTEQPTEKSKYATVAQIKYGFVGKFLTLIAGHHSNNTQEIKMERTHTGVRAMWKGLFDKS